MLIKLPCVYKELSSVYRVPYYLFTDRIPSSKYFIRIDVKSFLHDCLKHCHLFHMPELMER